MNNIRYPLFVLIGYLSGSVLYAYLLPKYIRHVDVTELSDDSNPGAANAFVFAGMPVGVLVIVMELAKGFFPVFLAARFVDTNNLWFAAVMAAPVIGHAYPIWWLRGGGKAIAVSFGVLMGLFPACKPLFLLAFCYLFFSLIVKINPHLYRSILAYLCFGLGGFFLGSGKSVVLGCLLIAAIVIWKHLKKYQGDRLSLTLALPKRKNV